MWLISLTTAVLTMAIGVALLAPEPWPEATRFVPRMLRARRAAATEPGA